MPSPVRFLTFAAAASATAAFQGFNYDAKSKGQTDFEADFKTAARLAGTNGGFTSARLFTMIQDGTANDPISAIPAAISTKTSLLFGLWASSGDDAFNNELTAVRKVANQYCSQLNGLVVGFSVGSEDLYRISPTGILARSNPGVGPDTLVGYIRKLRDTLKGTCFDKAQVGHVDTWTAWVNDTNKPVVEAVDWIGMDAYPFFEFQRANAISNGAGTFQNAFQQTQNAASGKPIWITETGWPVSSSKPSGDAVASPENAKAYWDQVGCPRFGNTNIWWYMLQDSANSTPDPSFGLVGPQLSITPLYDLTCSNTSTSTSSGATSGTILPSSAGAGAGPAGGPKSAAPVAAAGAATSGAATGGSSGSANGGVSGNGNAPAASRPASSAGIVPPAAGSASDASGAAGVSGAARASSSGASTSGTPVLVNSASRAHSFAAASFAALAAAAAAALL